MNSATAGPLASYRTFGIWGRAWATPHAFAKPKPTANRTEGPARCFIMNCIGQPQSTVGRLNGKFGWKPERWRKRMAQHGSKRVVVYGTGFVGKMVIAEIVKHPLFELVGVGDSNHDKVGRDVGEICGLPEPIGITATDDVDALIALKPHALVHYGPTAMHAKENISLITRFLRA